MANKNQRPTSFISKFSSITLLTISFYFTVSFLFSLNTPWCGAMRCGVPIPCWLQLKFFICKSKTTAGYFWSKIWLPKLILEWNLIFFLANRRTEIWWYKGQIRRKYAYEHIIILQNDIHMHIYYLTRWHFYFLYDSISAHTETKMQFSTEVNVVRAIA